MSFLLRRSLSASLLSCRHSSSSSNSNKLLGHIKARIRMKGPLTVAEYMREALGHPTMGYYMKKDMFGTKGDFTTSPEISQMFGELIGVWYLNEWMLLKELYKNDLPPCIQIIELGPGRGSLMNDLLKVWSKNKEIATASTALFVYLVESSPFLRKLQMKLLCQQHPEDDGPNLNEPYKSKYSPAISIIWLRDLIELPKKEAVHFVLANEFFDALPIQKFQRTANGNYREVLVGINEKNENNLDFILSQRESIGSKLVLKLHPNYSAFEHVEVSVESARYMETISTIISNYNGSALLIDYGHDGKCKDTFRAFKDHKLIEDVFQEPGECDLTADVDFSFLKHVATNNKFQLACYGPVDQQQFLTQMQIGARLNVLMRQCKTEEEKRSLANALRTLVDGDKMGSRFKLMALRKFDFKQAPPGFVNSNKI